MKLLPKEKHTYPVEPGVYRMMNSQDQIIYIGKAKNLKNRLTSYFDTTKRSPRINLMIGEIATIEVTTTASENDALVLEQKLINKLKPKYNIIFRDDKSYPFIAVSKHEFPKVYITREKTINLKKENLFGPYPKRDDAYQNVEFIQHIFKLRTCSDNEFAHRSRPCMLHGIGKCSAPCVKQDEPEFVEQYKDDVENAKSMLRGHVRPTIQKLQVKMEDAASNFRFEEAARLRDTISSLKDLSTNQTIFSLKEDNAMVFNFYQGITTYLGFAEVIDGVPQRIYHQEVKGDLKEYSLEELLTTYIESQVLENSSGKIISPLKLDNMFHDYQYHYLNDKQKSWLELVKNNLALVAGENLRKSNQQELTIHSLQDIFIHDIHSVDCIDISHHSGEATYGGKVRWASLDGENGHFDKPYYRLSKFEDKKIDDILHMKESINKIYHGNDDMPDVLVIDGGQEQLAAAYEGLKDKAITKPFVLMSSSKGVSRKKGMEVFYIHPTSYDLINPQYLSTGTLNLPKDHTVRLLFQKVQDAAHDFSNSARRKKMEKTRFG